MSKVQMKEAIELTRTAATLERITRELESLHQIDGITTDEEIEYIAKLVHDIETKAATRLEKLQG